MVTIDFDVVNDDYAANCAVCWTILHQRKYEASPFCAGSGVTASLLGGYI